MTFTDFKLDPSLLKGITDLGFATPTPIQGKALPAALEGRDVLGCAMTGSGKTAAFVLPILNRLLRLERGVTRALVVTPTRELASQIDEHVKLLGRHTRIRSAAVFGGVKPGPQERAFKDGVEVIVACPGRLLDLMQNPWARLADIEVLVLDEADRMLDMGFLPDIRRILAKLPKRRQTMLFSATMPAPIVALSKDFLVDPVRIDVERQALPPQAVSQAVLPVPEKLKPLLLLEMLRREEISTALVFTRTKHRANRLYQFLENAGIACERIHGNRSQPQREAALSGFKNGTIKVLVATDVAARGIDIAELPHVVNFDVPVVAEDYIHRVGRTARAACTGDALTLASPDEAGELAAIERAIGRRIERRQLAGFDYHAEAAVKLEIPIAQRIAEIRARKAEERGRAKAKAERKAAAEAQRGGSRPSSQPASRATGRPGGGPPAGARRHQRPTGPNSGRR
jgi:ATP-dependent RNA helicase RhlE